MTVCYTNFKTNNVFQKNGIAQGAEATEGVCQTHSALKDPRPNNVSRLPSAGPHGDSPRGSGAGARRAAGRL